LKIEDTIGTVKRRATVETILGLRLYVARPEDAL
jgi:hypothetical protein